MSTDDDRRNPYVLLGLPYGASLAEATRAFERRARTARWGDRGGPDLGDLEWALQRIEFEQTEPAAEYGTYRVPADPSVLRPPAGFGLLAPPPRATPRRSAHAPDDELAVIYDAARLDAAQHQLDRTAAAVGRRLERVSDEPLPTVTVPTPPERRRGWLPIAVVVAVAAVALAVAGIRAITDGDDGEVAPTTVATTEPAPASTVAATSTPATTVVDSALPGLGDPIEYGGLEVTPSDPLDGFGHLCLIFTIDGDVPLGFIREQVTLISAGLAVEPSLGVTTGRAANNDVFGDPAPAEREICFPIEGWQLQDTDLVYSTQVGNYRWRISEA